MLTLNISQQTFCDSGFPEPGRSWGGAGEAPGWASLPLLSLLSGALQKWPAVASLPNPPITF